MAICRYINDKSELQQPIENKEVKEWVDMIRKFPELNDIHIIEHKKTIQPTILDFRKPKIAYFYEVLNVFNYPEAQVFNWYSEPDRDSFDIYLNAREACTFLIGLYNGRVSCVKNN